jgi:signal transduction histidine kinase
MSLAQSVEQPSVNETLRSLRARFTTALCEYLAKPGEAGLLQAYRLGREALLQNASIADFTSIYADALDNAFLKPEISGNRLHAMRKGAEFLAESLAPFEMALRGYQEANQKLRQFNLTLEQRVAERTRELTEANRLKDEFLMTVSHELRTPLTAIVGWTARLRKNLDDPRKLEQALGAIETSSKAEMQIVEDLLDVSSIITGKLRLNTGPVDLAEVIMSAVEVISPAAEAKHIQLNSRLKAAQALVAGDFGRLRQVLWNLLSNSVKFTPEGGCVEIRLSREENHVEVNVCDTGAGIDPEFLPHVFDRFRQADGSSTRQHGGLGLGLAIVRYLVELHGGHVLAESPGEGKGAMFTVRLPLKVK